MDEARFARGQTNAARAAATMGTPWPLPGIGTLSPPPDPKKECTICNDTFDRQSMDIFLVDCGHYHCRDCLKLNSRMSISTKTFSPVRCCRVIDTIVLVRAGALTAEEKETYEALFEEYSTVEHRVYCFACNDFIPKPVQSDVLLSTIARSLQTTETVAP